MQLKELSVILTIAKHRSITNAAKELFVTQPALSMYLNNVETQLGTALFDRQEKPIKLTPAGELYVRKAKQIMLIKSEFDMELSTILSTHSTSITIALQTLRVPHLEPPLRTAVHSKFPNLQLTIKEGICDDLVHLLQTDKIDFLIANHSPLLLGNPEFATQVISSDKMLLAVPKKHPVARKYAGVSPKPPIDLHLFKNDTFFFNEPGSATRSFSETVFEMQGWRPTRSEVHPRTELNIAFCSQGLGVAFLFSSYLPYMRNRAIDYFPIANSESICCDLALVYKKGRFSPEFISNIREAAVMATKYII